MSGRYERSIADAVAEAGRSVANAITPVDALPGRTEDGAYVASATEALMAVASSLARIAESIDGLARVIAKQER